MTCIGVLIALVSAFVIPQAAPRQNSHVWVVPSVYKVRPDDPPQASNLVWSEKTKTVTLAGARNEHVPFQVVVSVPPPPTRHDKPASGFFLEASDLVAGSARIPSNKVRFYFEHVVLCYGKSSPVGGTGFWPDALAPLTDPFDMGAEFRSFVKNRAIWADVMVPKDAASGTYAGTVTVTRGGSPVDQLKVALRVYDFALPEETHLITYMGIWGNHLAPFYDSTTTPAQKKELVRKYYEFLYQNRMEPWFNEQLQPQIEEKANGEILVRFDDALYRHYMDVLKTKRVILETEPSPLRPNSQFPLFSEAYNRRLRSYLKQVADYYAGHGWGRRLVFNSPIDEPATLEHFDHTRRYASLVHEAAPGVPFLATKSPLPDRPELGTLVGYVNYFSVHGNELNSPAVKKAIAQEQAKGGEISWYISCDQVYPQPNYFIDAPAMDPVMVPWITWRYRMNGVLYWALNYWPQTPDPWIDPVTYLSGFLCSNGWVLNGEGSLIYPGSRTHRYTGQRNLQGPVSSIRFELLREGVEDYEYLWLLKTLGDGAYADQTAESMVVDVSAFSRNVEELFLVREQLAKRIESLAGAKRAGK